MKATPEIVRLSDNDRANLQVGDDILFRLKVVEIDRNDDTVKLAHEHQTTDPTWWHIDRSVYARLEPALKPGDMVRITGNPMAVATVVAVVEDHAWIGFKHGEYPGTIHPLKNLEKVA